MIKNLIFRMVAIVMLSFVVLSCAEDEIILSDCDRYLNSSSNEIVYSDVNNDGHMDFTVFHLYSVNVHLNDGNGNFTATCGFEVDENWDRNFTIGANNIIAADFEADGIKNDFIGFEAYRFSIESGRLDCLEMVFFNNMATANAEAVRLKVHEAESINFDGFTSLYPFMLDMDYDGYEDYVFYVKIDGDVKSIWLKNLKDGSFDITMRDYSEAPYLGVPFNNRRRAFPDLNNDGIKDLVSYSNPFFQSTECHISNGIGGYDVSYSLSHNDKSSQVVRLGDMNGDENQDIIVQVEGGGFNNPSGLQIYINNNANTDNIGESGSLFLEKSCDEYYVAKINNDDLSDIVFKDNDVWYWVENKIDSTNWEWEDGIIRNLDLQIENYDNILFNDIDSDGDSDMLLDTDYISSIGEYPFVYLYRNENGVFVKTKLL